MKEWLEIATKEKKTSNEKALLEIVNLEYPTSLNDQNLLKNLEILYPKKKKIEQSKLNTLASIYSEKFHGDYSLAACEPIYRDILIFKKENNIIGVSKICFECGLHYTIGTTKNTEQLGQNGDYEKLNLLLKD